MVPGFLGILKSRSALAELRSAAGGLETVLLKAVRVKNEINPSKNAREFRKIVRNSLAV